jgi:hypothetical protein
MDNRQLSSKLVLTYSNALQILLLLTGLSRSTVHTLNQSEWVRKHKCIQEVDMRVEIGMNA